MTEKQFTEKQLEAIDMAKALAQKGMVGIIAGCAGTGKTFALSGVIEQLECTLLAPTGKAAVRVSELTGCQATTVHRWLYDVKETVGGAVRFEKRPLDKISIPEGKLIVVDEASMIPQDMYNDLIETVTGIDCGLLLVGDPFQLPPVTKEKGVESFSVFDLDIARVTLDEIMRQAEKSPVIKLSRFIREGEIAEAMDVADLVLDKKVGTKVVDVIDGGGMVLVHSNKARHHVNRYYREQKGLTDIQTGEPLLVLKNNYKLNVFNGETFDFEGYGDFVGENVVYCMFSKKEAKIKFYMTTIGGQPCIVSPNILEGEAQELSVNALETSVGYWVRKGVPYIHANFGYALSVHKSQGSETETALLLLEPTVNLHTIEGRRFAYTGITRARSKVYLGFLGRNLSETLPVKEQNVKTVVTNRIDDVQF